MQVTRRQLNCRYVIEDDKVLFSLQDGSKAWEVKDFLIEQERCYSVTVEGNEYFGKGSDVRTRHFKIHCNLAGAYCYQSQQYLSKLFFRNMNRQIPKIRRSRLRRRTITKRRVNSDAIQVVFSRLIYLSCIELI